MDVPPTNISPSAPAPGARTGTRGFLDATVERFVREFRADRAQLYTGPGPSARLLGDGETASAVWVSAGDLTNAYTVTACFPFASEPSTTRTVTTVAIDAEAICTERTVGGQIVNPVAFPVGETATFRAKVFPEDVPDLMVRWRIVSGSDFARIEGPAFGREVVLRGLDEGTVELELWMPGYVGPLPKFTTRVHPLRPVPVAAWIVCDDSGVAVTTASHVEDLIEAANAILRQTCVSCYVHRVFMETNSECLDLGNYPSYDFQERYRALVSASNVVDGVEIHLVRAMGTLRGLQSRDGIVMRADAGPETFAHEVGHDMGLPDIYIVHDDAWVSISGKVRRSRCEHDWFGTDERGFYPDIDSLSQSNLIERLVMHGIGISGRGDFSCGPIDGLMQEERHPNPVVETMVPVGVFYPHPIPLPAND